MRLPPIFLLTGPPGAGKTTLARELLARFERGVHLEVDRLRATVVQGLSDSVPWTEETERQFQIAEEATLDVALRYQEAGFAVAVDHCRNLPRLDDLATRRLAERPHVKLCLLPDLQTNLERNRMRTNKDFDPEVLADTIRAVHARYLSDLPRQGWVVLDPSERTPRSLVDECFATLDLRP